MFSGAIISEISTVRNNMCLIHFSEVISYHKCDKIIDISVLKFTIEGTPLTTVEHWFCIIIMNLVLVAYKKRNGVLVAYKGVLVSLIPLKSLTSILGLTLENYVYKSIKFNQLHVDILFFFLVLLFFSAKILVSTFHVLKFQSTSHVLLFFISMKFCFVLVYMEYLIYFNMLPKRHLSGSQKRKKKAKWRANKITTRS
jgi:hypothetical protein